MSDAAAPAASAAPAPAKKDHNKYRKPKEWDVEGTEHWKIDVRARATAMNACECVHVERISRLQLQPQDHAARYGAT